MLRPEHVGARRALHDAMRVLDVGIVAALGRHELGVHAVRGEPPAFAAVARLPGAAAGNAHRDAPVVARVDANGMDARMVVTAAKPLGALGPPPQAVDEGPGFAAIARLEQAARNAARPQRPRGIRLKRPDL